MVENIKNFITEQKLIARNVKTIFAAVSGGVDSCVMLDVLYRLRDDLGFDLRIVHFNHRTRGIENKMDEEFVEELAQNYGIKIKIGRLKTSGVNKNEAFLREKRYKFFTDMIAADKNALIATAHNMDDDVETFFMRMVRGSRLRGLLGIPVKRGPFIRPLLTQSRKNIELYARKNKIAYRFDRSNRNNSIKRNLIRNEIIPFIEKSMNINLKANVNKVLRDLKNHYVIYEELLTKALKESVKNTRHGKLLNRRRYHAYPEPVRRGLVEYCISEVQPLNYGISDKNFFLWEDFIRNGQTGKKFNFYDDKEALLERNFVVFGDIPENRDEKYILKAGKKIVIDKKVILSCTDIDKDEVIFSENKKIEFIDGDKSGPELLVRFWQDGDIFKPLGMSYRRKLSDFFTDLKLNSRIKKETPIIVSKKLKKIIWIAGYRLDENFKISKNTKKYYKLELKEIQNEK